MVTSANVHAAWRQAVLTRVLSHVDPDERYEVRPGKWRSVCPCCESNVLEISFGETGVLLFKCCPATDRDDACDFVGIAEGFGLAPHECSPPAERRGNDALPLPIVWEDKPITKDTRYDPGTYSVAPSEVMTDDRLTRYELGVGWLEKS